ncbi:MAG: hypothetical protein IJ228_04485 [Succinivibrio sp.]|nr:hypothetical protein [Succinivibrio sp.]
MERYLIAVLCLSSLVGLAACSANPAPYGKKTGKDNIYQLSGMEISKVSSQMADMLVATMSANLRKEELQKAEAQGYLTAQRPEYPKIAVTSFVDTDTYEDAGYLGRELGELFVHELDRRSVPVSEFKTTGHISVTEEGEIIYSRNWRKIAKQAMVQHVLGGTITRNDKGVVLVARVIDMNNVTVLGSATGFIPYHLLPDCYRTAKKNCSMNGVTSYSFTYTMPAPGDKGADVKPVKGSKYSSSSSGSSYYAGSSSYGQPYYDTDYKYPATKDGEKSKEQLIDERLHSSPNLRKKYYMHGARTGGTSMGNYDEYLYQNNDDRSWYQKFGTSGKVPVIYPAGSYLYNDGLVRDVHDANQYSRIKQ